MKYVFQIYVSCLPHFVIRQKDKLRDKEERKIFIKKEKDNTEEITRRHAVR